MKMLLAIPLAFGLGAGAIQAAEVSAQISDRDGNSLGGVTVRDTASGTVLATVTLSGLPDGIHAIHLHETGDCSAADFASAGGHIAGEHQHGVLSEGGPHPGDMPNLTVNQDGVGEIEVFLPLLQVERDLMDADGAAFIIHAGIDDYQSQPAGGAGDRIACGAFQPR
ncbi:superoxide dismutase family protein [Paracoccus sp. MBLB3053]|uniref:Superoxide dismutase family protein n=1 Tax=Paracoccus aurantius TaxID=3073814 RepID=A0ABU2HV01_9RHOB|nr:superoxide dismutase family protein [Paracoccus sp. MBLB3053]MDS9468861.1 superoxide dismutase family protein [Paracoccus sp. MBLB3053]